MDRAAALAKELGARRVVPLKVSGPFHTSLAPAGDALREKFRRIAFGASFQCSSTARASDGGRGHHPRLLERQVQTDVYMGGHHPPHSRAGGGHLCGDRPGQDPLRLCPKTVTAASTYAIDTAEDLDAVLTALKGA